MRYTRYIFAALVAVLALSSCKKNYLPVSDHPFDISTPKVEATRAVVDVIPDNNDFHYMFGVAPAEVYEATGQEAFVSMIDNSLKSTYKILFDTESLEKFLDWMYRGAYDEVVHDLVPDTRYIAFAYPYEETTPVSSKFTKLDFRTPAITKSANTFIVSIDSTVISVCPSNGDTYFFDYCTPEELKDYYMSIDYFYRKTIDVYWEYGFLDNSLNSGNSTENIKQYYPKVNDGDIFYMALSGYDKGITTDVTYYKITIHTGPAAKSTIEIIPDFDLAGIDHLRSLHCAIGRSGYHQLRQRL